MKNNREAYKQAAIKLAKAICRDAIWHDKACNWTGLATEFDSGGRTIYSRALPPGFYDGVAGVAFFLLQVYCLHTHPLILKTIKGSIQQLLSADDKAMPNGFYHGRAGIVFVVELAAEILKDRSLDKEAGHRLDLLLSSVKDEIGNDIISGTAGIILFLLYLHKKENKKNLLATALALGDKLIERADKTEYGSSWKTMEGPAQNLTGFAHGASGIGTALIELYVSSKEDRFLLAAKEAFHYEDLFFNKQKQNWADLRFAKDETNGAEGTYSLAWCHGAPGIGLARLRAYGIAKKKYFLDSAKMAAATTAKYLQQESNRNYSLCHGLFGNALFLVRIANATKMINYKKQVIQLADQCLEEYISRNVPFPNGYLSDHESPCFMQGNSGIGFFFLYLYDPRRYELPFLLPI